MRNALHLGRIFGVEIRLDYSWFIIFALSIFSLATHYFPKTHFGWPVVTYWALAVITSLLFFASVLAHELAHSLASISSGIPVRRITLFIFGGAAEITREVERPGQELLMALAGPFTSLVIALFFGTLWLVSSLIGGPIMHALSAWLGWINVSLALFNLIPGFPLDGGRVLRAIVWAITGNFRQATGIATGVGQVVAYLFIFSGFWQVLTGNWINGLWIAFIGWFLQNAAIASYRRVALRETLQGVTAGEVMMTDCPRVSPQLTLQKLVDEVLLPSGRRCFPVMTDDQVMGLITLHHIKEVPRERWPAVTVEQAMTPFAQLKVVCSDEEVFTVLERMTVEDLNQLPVVDNGHLLGMVTRSNILDIIRTRTALGL